MNNRSGKWLVAAFVLCTAGASASTIVKTFDFTASGFTSTIPPGLTAPVDPVTGSVTVAFDPAGAAVSNDTTGISLNSLNIALGSAIAFNYDPAFDRMTIGGLQYSVNGLGFGTDDFFLVFRGASTSPVGDLLTYSQTGFNTSFTTSGPDNVAVTASSPVPEPAAWTLTLAGFLAAGAARRRRAVSGSIAALSL